MKPAGGKKRRAVKVGSDEWRSKDVSVTVEDAGNTTVLADKPTGIAITFYQKETQDAMFERLAHRVKQLS